MTTISIAGNIGSGKSSVARRISEITGWPTVSTGAIFRDLAARRGLTVLELNELAETDSSIDDEVDGHLRRLAESGQTAVIDSRMAWHFVPESFKVYLVVDAKVAVERVYGAVREDERYATVEEAANDVLTRQRVEAERYLGLYSVHVDDWRNYDLVLDTSRVTVEEVADLVMAHLDRRDDALRRPVCHLDPQRLLPSALTPGEPAPESVAIAVFEDRAIIVSGHDLVADALRRGDTLVRCELAAFEDESVSGVPVGEYVDRAVSGDVLADWERAHGFSFGVPPVDEGMSE